METIEDYVPTYFPNLMIEWYPHVLIVSTPRQPISVRKKVRDFAHGYGWPTIGWMEDIRALALPDGRIIVAERPGRIERRCERGHGAVMLEARARRVVDRYHLSRISIAGRRRQELVDRGIAAA